MKNIIALSLILAVGFVLNACSNDPLIPPQQNNDGYQQVYHEPGVQDSMSVGTLLYDYLDLGILDFTNSESIKISFDYVAHNTLTYQFSAYYYENYPNPTYLANLNTSGSQNTYKHVEFTASSPNSLTTFYYVISRTNREDSYMVLRNFKISKK